MSAASAWVMQLDHIMSAAVGRMELIHIVDAPELIKVPKTPEYCRHIILWNGKVIPVINLSAWLNDSTVVYQRSLVAIAAYRDAQDKVQYGGIHLSETPVLENVTNEQEASLPASSNLWRYVSVSCFKNKDNIAVPVLDVQTIFSSALTDITKNADGSH